MYHGECEASNLGHAGAGNFWDDVWALVWRDGALRWKKLILEGKLILVCDYAPQPSADLISQVIQLRRVVAGSLQHLIQPLEAILE